MMSLDDPSWADLKQAYGSASPIPEYLRTLESEPFEPVKRYASGTTKDGRTIELGSEDVWDKLWSSLCHQHDVYSASYAASPHILRIAKSVAERAPDRLDWRFLFLPASIELDRREPVPAALESAYWDGLRSIIEIAYSMRNVLLSPELARGIAAGVLVANGCKSYARVLVDIEESELFELLGDVLPLQRVEVAPEFNRAD